jgi:hypothetical protein
MLVLRRISTPFVLVSQLPVPSSASCRHDGASPRGRFQDHRPLTRGPEKALGGPVRMLSHQEHDHDGDDVGNGVDATDDGIARAGQSLDDRGQPHLIAVAADVHQEIEQAKEPDAPAAQGIDQGILSCPPHSAWFPG